MNQTENKPTQKHMYKYLIAGLLGIVVMYLVVTFVVDQRLSELQIETQVAISEQQALLASIAQATARNGGDAVTERIIQDCELTDRARFDSLLGQLNNGLSQAELIELERLFGRCGNFFAERKAVMVARLMREVEIYEIFVTQLNTLSEENSLATFQVSKWKQLAELEEKQSELFTQLVNAQDEIITSLLAGNTAGSDEVTAILQEANEIQETLLVTNTQASTLRSSLVSF